MQDASIIAAVRLKYADLVLDLDERGSRRWAAVEARSLGRGGIAAVATATGMSDRTIRTGLKELATPSALDAGRQRRVGGGRKPRAVFADPPRPRGARTIVKPGVLRKDSPAGRSAARGSGRILRHKRPIPTSLSSARRTHPDVPRPTGDHRSVPTPTALRGSPLPRLAFQIRRAPRQTISGLPALTAPRGVAVTSTDSGERKAHGIARFCASGSFATTPRT